MRKNIYDELNSDMIRGDIRSYDSEGIVNLIKTRYSKDLFEEPLLASEKFFASTKTNLNNQFFLKLGCNAQKELACTILNAIKNFYCKEFDLTPQLLWFLSAAIHVCFYHLRESDQEFREMFCTFNTEEGVVESFCRLIVVSETERYCTCLCNDIRDWHKAVIKFDGEAYGFLMNALKDTKIIQCIIEYLWFYQDNKKFSSTKTTSYGFFINANTSSSIYWSIRKTCNLL